MTRRAWYTEIEMIEAQQAYMPLGTRAKWALGGGAILFAVVIYGIFLLQETPRWSAHFEAADGKVLADSAMSFTFSRPVTRQVNFSINPPITGNWFFDDKLSRLHLTRTFRFEPTTTWEPDTTYTITIEGMKNIFAPAREEQKFSYSFSTQSIPTVASIVPEEGKTIASDSVIQVALSSPNTSLADFSLITNPAIEFSQTIDETKKLLTFTPLVAFQQGESYTAQVMYQPKQIIRDSGEVIYTGDQKEAASFKWNIVEPPGVASYAPIGNTVLTDAAVQVAFQSELQDDSVSKIIFEPQVAGMWKKSGTTITFEKSAALAFATTYRIIIPQGTRTVDGGIFEKDESLTFTTIGPVSLQSSSPKNSETGVAAERSIRMTFDQEVDHVSAQSSFSLSPNVTGSFSWSGNTMIFDPAAPFELAKTYSVTLSKGIISVLGQPSATEAQFSFATEPPMVKLAMASDHQDYKLSCEIAALKMALASKGVRVSENDIIAKVGYASPLSRSGNVWADPQVGFVGNINGRQVSTGYGVYWDPIQKAASAWREAESFTNGSIQKLTDEISKGNPIVVWGNAGSGKRVDWKTPSGKNIVAIMGEHARTVKGFIGPKENPIKIIVNDPLIGEVVWSTAAFDANWATLGRSGVIVR